MANDQLRIIKDQIDSFVRSTKQKRDNEDRQFLMSSIGETIGKNLMPLMRTMADNTRLNRDDFVELVNYLKTELGKVEIKMPDIQIPDVIVPEPKVTVNIPPIKVPDVIMPDEMNVKGWVNLMGVDLNNPLPVQLRDAKGNPVNFYENLTQIISGGGGGFAKTVKVTNTVPITAGESLIVNQLSGAVDSVNILQLAGTATAVNSGVVNDGTLRIVHATDVAVSVRAIANSGVDIGDVDILSIAAGDNNIGDMDVRQVSGAVDSVVVNDVLVTVGVNQVSGASWSVTATNAFLTDTELRASSVPVTQVSGASWSVNAGTVTVTATDLDVRDLVNATDSVSAYQVSGASWSVTANANSGVDIGDVDVTSVIPGTGATSLGKAEDAAHASADVGVFALTVRNSTNTTFAADGDYQPIATDGIGRIITRPVQTRGLLQTAYVSMTTGTETTLLAGAASTYFDLTYIMATNNSDAAVTVDLRSATGGGIVTSIRVPANGTAGVSLDIPIPQDVAADTWTADIPDITGTTVTLGALFSREV